VLISALQCVTKCCEKFMNVSARTGARFQEFFTEMEKQVRVGGVASSGVDLAGWVWDALRCGNSCGLEAEVWDAMAEQQQQLDLEGVRQA
jgi:hypothetical protein